MLNQYFATNRKVGDGSTTVWEFSFAGARPDANNGTAPYLEPADVGVALVSYDAEGRETRTPVSFTLTGPSQVQVTPAIAAGQDFVIYRQTESELPASDFTDFASISEQDLDNAIRQTLFVVQEARDDLEDGNENAATARGIANSAAAEAASATATANSATATANTALSTANSASSAAANAVSVASSAAADAATATSTANQALGEAEDAALAVAGAISTADSAAAAAAQAVNTANTANSTASSANTTANTALSTANTAASNASTALSTANAAVLTANAADAKADEALSGAAQAQADASLVVGFQQQLDSISAAVNDLTGVESGAITLNSDNLSKLTDFAAARANLGVYSKGEVNALVDSSGGSLEPRVVAVEDAVGTLQTDVGTLQTDVGNLQADVSEAQSGISGLQDSKADKSLVLTAGTGLSGGGDLSANRSFAVDATVVRTSRSVSAGNGLSGGGDLSADRTISLGTPGTLDGSTTNSVTAASHTHAISSTTARNNPSTSTLLAAAAMNNHRISSDHDARYTLKSETSSISSQVQELDSRLEGFGSAAPSIANSYIPVGSRGTFEGSESAAVAAGLPALGGSEEPRHWSIDSFGSESPARGVQMAVEVFGIGTTRGRTFIRVRHDATWHPWKELGGGGASSSAGAVGTYAFLYSPSSNAFGATEAGANLHPASTSSSTPGSVSGTWRCMGWGSGANITVWLRIA